jgi:hypothetical protein
VSMTTNHPTSRSGAALLLVAAFVILAILTWGVPASFNIDSAQMNALVVGP